ncbi:MAG: acetate--CoA ligase family protein, partial [Candidatus Adiutrix sp.]|nr:acetate--CoA ligase family protein [Candidatus Adiutrix sp.]
LNRYLVVNVHPGDLSVTRDGHRPYAGADGVGQALNDKAPYLRSSAHLANAELDAGPVLMLSEKIPVQYPLADFEADRKAFLRQVNEEGRKLGSRVLLELALGNLSQDSDGKVHYQGRPAQYGLEIESWNENIPLAERHTELLVKPKSVAVIGASSKGGLGQAVVRNLLDDKFPGPVYAVNVKGEDVLGAKGYPNISAIPADIDLAVITVPSKAVLAVAEECGQKGVKAVICITAGFKEVGAEGREMEEKLRAIVNKYNMRATGPNCMGLINTAADFNATMIDSKIAKGHVALITQSGALGAAILDSAKDMGLGFSTIVSLGNQMDMSATDFLPILEADPETKVIIFYLEGIINPVRFCQVASRMKTPILLLKSGKTAFGASAASSHTGSLAGSDSVVQALVEKAGILRMNSVEECCIAAIALSSMPQISGKRVGLLTNAGGPGILISDALFEAGFEMPPVPEEVQKALYPQLLPESSVKNPVDVVAAAKPEHYAIAAKAMMDSGAYDALLMCCVPPATVDTGAVAKAFCDGAKEAKTQMPIVSTFFGPSISKAGREYMQKAGVPVYEFPEQVVPALKSLLIPKKYPLGSYNRLPSNDLIAAKKIVNNAQKGSYLSMTDALNLLDCFKIEALKSAMIKTEAEAAQTTLRFPVVAKIDHPEIVHKSDVGGVKIGLANPAELAQTVKEFLAKFKGANGVLVQEMAPKGVELIVGSSRDPELGSTVMVGLGGTWVEIFGDVAFGYPPLSKELVLDMVDRLKCKRLLSGYRGDAGVSMDALTKTLVNVGNMLLTLPEIEELDLNPVIYDPKLDTFVAVDVRIKIN